MDQVDWEGFVGLKPHELDADLLELDAAGEFVADFEGSHLGMFAVYRGIDELEVFG